MSAWMPDKQHFDVLVRACLEQGSPSDKFSWFVEGEDGEPSQWRKLEYRSFGPGISLYAMMGGETAQPGEVTADELGQLLMDECRKSLEHRYPDTVEGLDFPGDKQLVYDGYEFTDPGFEVTAGEVYKTIDCLDYQSCEHPGWPGSEAHTILRALRHAYCCKTPGYESAPWGWDARLVEQRLTVKTSVRA